MAASAVAIVAASAVAVVAASAVVADVKPFVVVAAGLLFAGVFVVVASGDSVFSSVEPAVFVVLFAIAALPVFAAAVAFAAVVAAELVSAVAIFAVVEPSFVVEDFYCPVAHVFVFPE